MTDAEIQQALQALQQLGAAAGNSKAGIAAVGQSMARLRGEMQRGTGTIQQNTQELRKLMTDFDQLDRAARSSAAGQTMLAEQSKMAGQIMRDAAGQMSGALIKGGVIEAVSFFKNQVFAAAESYTQGVSGTSAALKQQQVGIQSNIDLLNRLSTGLTLSAEMLALIPNPAARLGAVLTATGAVTAKLMSEEEQIRKNAYELLGRELSAATLGYQSQTKAGLVYTAGLKEQRDTQSELRLTTAEMTGIVTRNNKELTQFGGSVLGGVVRLKSVNNQLNTLTDGSQSLREQLYRIGISYEDQSQGIIDYVTLQQQAGQLEGKSSKQLAEESAKYMTNLRAISAFTGEDVKSAKARSQAASEQLAVQAKLRKSQDPKAMEKFQAMIASMPADMQKGMQQMVAFDGTIVDKNLNILLSQSPTRKQALDEAFADFQSGMYDAAQLQEREQERMKKYGKAIEEEGLAMGPTLGAVNLATGQFGEVVGMAQNQVKLGQKGQNDLFDYVNQVGQKLGTTAEQFADLKKRGTDPLTESVTLLDTKFREVQRPEYDRAITDAITTMVTRGSPEEGYKGTLAEQNEKAMQNTLKALGELKLLKDIPEIMPTIVNTISTNEQSVREFGLASTGFASATSKFDQAVEKFRGGVPSASTGAILDGSESGHLAMLHGREAVIPLGDGNSVNVAFKNPAGILENTAAATNAGASGTEQALNEIFNSPNMMTTALTELKNIMTADSQMTQSLMKQYTEKMDALISTIEDGNRNTREIANNIA